MIDEIKKKEIMESLRERMIKEHLIGRDITDRNVLKAMNEIPRELFIPEKYLIDAYGDHPLPIGHGQTISQPYIVALMTQLAELTGDEKVLEIGCGSGYQAAILSKLASKVYTIERIEALAKRARSTLDSLRISNVEVIHGDGYNGHEKEAPFDAIILTAAPETIPQKLLSQLNNNGRLIAPVGDSIQELVKITRSGNQFHRETITYVRFVPMLKGAINN
ncbi:MAG TPA: protein-L-isoaspartate(D-aspartate) O-methyltransferase [Spirochaetota bacterium]|jgi:protein-L-isoaspartate(D-aspartate) O-methyltransferase|nr:protein-L-isoaspartate(D-aspartate) O-methyltransferase [Spirochaetota bacterium]OQA97192.1 MAG: Protein-L-isoaspartate O-methyltransferase [Spirochaetes bacterium ADurb.Bin218]HON15784.1 protein-L-isoaspartate(D-aspartate) O-methyltransferase [Spirochaetota bacterium]HOQ12071.1 protein-L-isoaspartate(D-aspartate) O-methyltransferase [Spirochaetota bacterium]HOV08548.1 protein-L-isoaspartate(D-aspartate) O-methyltransferase [Spirochaetota bacterium]